MHHFLDNILKFNTAGKEKIGEAGFPGFATTTPFKTNTEAVLREFIKNLDKNLDKKKTASLLYKPAKINSGGPQHKKGWFVFFYFRRSIEQKFKRFKITGDINRIKHFETRELAAIILQRTINEALDNAWNPFNDLTIAPSVPDYINIVVALNDAVKSKTATLRKRSAGSYKSVVKFFVEWLNKEQYQQLDINKISPLIMQQYQNYLLEKGYSAKTINNKFDAISAIFAKLKKLQLLKENPCLAIDTLPEEDTGFFEPLTDEEINHVASHLKKVCPELFIFMLLIYYSLLRPQTIVQLKREHLDFTTRQIIVPGKLHKNRKKWIKQMLQPLYDYLIEYGYDKIPADEYLFSTKLIPGKVEIQPVRASEQWKKYIIEGLKINKKMYALKHTMGTNYLNDNLGTEDLQWLKMQMAHSSLDETNTYVRNNTVKLLDETKSTIRKI